MFLLAHLAAGYVAGRVWNVVAPRHRVSLLWSSIGGILPDLIDKPLSLTSFIVGGRNIAHTLLFFVGLVALARVDRRFLALAIGVATHLALDDPTTYFATLMWPFLGVEFTPDEDMSPEAIERHLTKSGTAIAEIAAATFLLLVITEKTLRSIFRRRREGFLSAASEERRGSTVATFPVDGKQIGQPDPIAEPASG